VEYYQNDILQDTQSSHLPKENQGPCSQQQSSKLCKLHSQMWKLHSERSSCKRWTYTVIIAVWVARYRDGFNAIWQCTKKELVRYQF